MILGQSSEVAQFEFEIRENTKTSFKSLFATRDFEKGEILSKIGYEKILYYPDRYTVQLGENKHIILQPSYLQYINHNCDPNVFFDLTNMEIVALKTIKAGDELGFFYPSTEWKMTESFNCLCGARNCRGRIEGAYNLPVRSFSEYKFSDYIKTKFAQR